MITKSLISYSLLSRSLHLLLEIVKVRLKTSAGFAAAQKKKKGQNLDFYRFEVVAESSRKEYRILLSHIRDYHFQELKFAS
ncbi:hypothetical protein AC249_AIPGENE3859 [Exaiptasia diaphana]|nr:hypothetical protein AC249_AIPGENE3859 [Exaiptasia diaphana]